MHLSSNFYVNSVRVRGLEKALLEGLMGMVVGLKQRGCQEDCSSHVLTEGSQNLLIF